MNEDQIEAIQQAKEEANLQAVITRYGRGFVRHEVLSARRQILLNTREGRRAAVTALERSLATAKAPRRRRMLEARINAAKAQIARMQPDLSLEDLKDDATTSP